VKPVHSVPVPVPAIIGSYGHSAHDSPSLQGIPGIEFGEMRKIARALRKRDDEGSELAHAGDAIADPGFPAA
jgi:hypothetical protein